MHPLTRWPLEDEVTRYVRPHIQSLSLHSTCNLLVVLKPLDDVLAPHDILKQFGQIGGRVLVPLIVRVKVLGFKRDSRSFIGWDRRHAILIPSFGKTQYIFHFASISEIWTALHTREKIARYTLCIIGSGEVLTFELVVQNFHKLRFSEVLEGECVLYLETTS